MVPAGIDGFELCASSHGSNSGGGGGAAGRIRINSLDGSALIGSGAVFSPTAVLYSCQGSCSQGQIEID